MQDIQQGTQVQKKSLINPKLVVTILLCSLYFIMYLDRVNISLSAKDMMKEFGFHATEIGIAFSAFSYPYLVGQLTGGWMVKQWGARLSLFICGCVVALSTIYTGFITGLITLFIARLLLGCGEGPTFSAATAAMRNWYPTHRFGFIQGITHSASRFGGAVAPPLVAWFIILDGWRAAFYVCGGLSLLWAILWYVFYRNDPHQHPAMSAEDLKDLPPPSIVTRQSKIPFKALGKRMLPVTMVDFCYGWMLWVFISWLPLFFQNVHGLNLKNSALLAGLTMAAGVVGDTLGGMISDHILVKTGRKRLARNLFIAISFCMGGTFLLGTLFTSDLTTISILLCLSFFSMELICGTIWAVPMDISRNYAGVAGGMMNFGFGLAGIISPIVFGMVVDITGSWVVPFSISVSICGVGAILTWFMHPERPFDGEADAKAA